MPFDSQRVLSDLLSPSFTPTQLRVGETWAFSTFDPLSYGVGTATAHVTGRERIKLDGAEEDTFVIQLASGSYEATVWANPQGEVVKEKVLGFTLLREEPDAL